MTKRRSRASVKGKAGARVSPEADGHGCTRRRRAQQRKKAREKKAQERRKKVRKRRKKGHEHQIPARECLSMRHDGRVPHDTPALVREPSFVSKHSRKWDAFARKIEAAHDLCTESLIVQVESEAPIEETPKPSEPLLCEEQLQLVDLVMSGRNVFFTGGAGTGKSTVLRAIVKKLQQQKRQVQVVTPTGISALNVGGITYFTYAGWTPSIMKESIKDIEAMALSKERRCRIQNTDVLIIDEISMLEANQFKRLDRACRAARGRAAAFGGIQVVVSGDFYQLPPVKPFQTCYECGVELLKREVCLDCSSSEERSMVLPGSPRQRGSCLQCGIDLSKRMDCPMCHVPYHMNDQWAFCSDTWDACGFRYVSLTQVHRQSDPVFIELLNALRLGNRLSRREMKLLGRPNDVGTAIELSPLRHQVDLKNLRGFQAITGAIRVYRCQDHVYIQPHHPYLKHKALLDSDGNRSGCQDHRFPPLLETKFGMPVILLANLDIGAGLVNGSQGRIVGYVAAKSFMPAHEQRWLEIAESGRLEDGQVESWRLQQTSNLTLPVVCFNNGLQRIITPVCQSTLLGDPKPFSVVARTQIPLLPAWAITIHKSQGMTLERVVVNLDHVFEPQMAYVALSRAQSLAGLRVISRIGIEALLACGRLGCGDRAVQEFMNRQFRVSSPRTGKCTQGGTSTCPFSESEFDAYPQSILF